MKFQNYIVDFTGELVEMTNTENGYSAPLDSICTLAGFADTFSEGKTELLQCYKVNDQTYTAINEYLDTWCGSVEEEEAFISAGVEPY